MNTTQLEFSLDRYQELVVEKQTHTLATRHGDNARVLARNLKGDLPIAVAVEIDSEERAFRYTINGRFSSIDKEHMHDLVIVPKPPKSLGWVNVFRIGENIKADQDAYPTKEIADSVASGASATRVACVEVYEGMGIGEEVAG